MSLWRWEISSIFKNSNFAVIDCARKSGVAYFDSWSVMTSSFNGNEIKKKKEALARMHDWLILHLGLFDKMLAMVAVCVYCRYFLLFKCFCLPWRHNRGWFKRNAIQCYSPTHSAPFVMRNLSRIGRQIPGVPGGVVHLTLSLGAADLNTAKPQLGY